MTTETSAAMTAEQIRARLREIAPYPAENEQAPVTARVLARAWTVNAQARWTRNLSQYFDGRDEAFHDSANLLCAEFAFIYTLMALAEENPQRADVAAETIRGALTDGGLVGELLYEHGEALGIDVPEVCRLEEAWQALPEVKAARANADLAGIRRAAQTLARITESYRHVMETARIEMKQSGPHEAMQWILNSLPDVWDDPASEWDGFESAQEWFDRTEPSYRPPAEVDLTTYNQGFRDLLPAERLAVSITSARLARGEDPLPSTTEVLLSALKRLTGEGQEQAAKEGR